MPLLRGASVWVLIAQVVALHGLQSEEAIVYPEFLDERSDNGARTVKIKDDLTLSLVQKSPFRERLHLRTPQQDGSVLNTYVSSSLYSSKLFQDEDNFASLVVTDNNGFHFQGMIGDDLRIEPLLTAERSSEGHVAHRLYKVEEVSSDTPIYQYVSEPDSNTAARSVDNDTVSEPDSNTAARSVDNDTEGVIDKHFARVETHIVVDSVLFAQFKRKKTDAILYFGAAINFINLRYNTVETIEVEIVAIAFTFYEDGNEEANFLKFYNVRDASWDEYGNIHSTLAAFRDFYKRNHADIFYQADLLSFVTGRDMCSAVGNTVSCDVSGLAYLAGVCDNARTSMVEDKAWSFNVVRVMAHELAHNLGCVHDGDDPYAHMEGHPGAKGCPWNDGYLMSYVTQDNRQFQFSRCCAEQILFVSELEDKLCLYYNNSGKSDRVETGDLPGDRVSLDKLCQTAFAHVTGYKFMFDRNTGLSGNGCVIPCRSNEKTVGRERYWRYGNTQGLDGSRCDPEDENKLCIRGECKSHKRCEECHNRTSQPKAPPTTTTTTPAPRRRFNWIFERRRH
ncbi:venom metalloproteinase antarease TserMP_A-like [Ornithodoros turicata]|uniref:venom metalloproteinase antarease TserMP_A-like n=1 Tax=Ornithodoros turicata TaxID=34597 RepID=UPI003138FF61